MSLLACFLIVLGAGFEIVGVVVIGSYALGRLRDEELGKLERRAKVAQRWLSQRWRAFDSRLRRLLGLKPRTQHVNVQGVMATATGSVRVGAVRTSGWNNDSYEESIAELRRASECHEERIAKLKSYIQTLEAQIGKLNPNFQRNIAEAKEQIMTAGGWGVVFLLVGIVSTLSGSIIGIVSG